MKLTSRIEASKSFNSFLEALPEGELEEGDIIQKTAPWVTFEASRSLLSPWKDAVIPYEIDCSLG